MELIVWTIISLNRLVYCQSYCFIFLLLFSAKISILRKKSVILLALFYVIFFYYFVT